MQILVVNDDGPISASSPYIYPFVTALHAAGHQTSVVLPNIPRSWIGKAHIVGSTLECSDYTPAPGENGWVLVTGTPASCTQLGLYHLFQDVPPPDLVISGPNFGRNATTIYNLSSGTVGGALEAALCQKKAVALSFASKDKQSPAVIAAAARHSVKLIESLYHNWGSGVELYNINVPMIPDVEDHGILYTQALRSSWSTGSLYQELDMRRQSNGVSHETSVNEGRCNGHPQDDQAMKGYTNGVIEGGSIVNGTNGVIEEGSTGNGANGIIEGGSIVNGESKGAVVDVPGPNSRSNGHGSPRRRYFKWAPQLSDIARSVEKSPPGTDAWAIKNGYTSVTPLTANFVHVRGFSGNIKLRPDQIA